MGPSLAESPTKSTKKIRHVGNDRVWHQSAEYRQIKVYVKPFGAELCHKVRFAFIQNLSEMRWG